MFHDGENIGYPSMCVCVCARLRACVCVCILPSLEQSYLARVHRISIGNVRLSNRTRLHGRAAQFSVLQDNLERYAISIARCLSLFRDERGGLFLVGRIMLLFNRAHNIFLTICFHIKRISPRGGK